MNLSLSKNALNWLESILNQRLGLRCIISPSEDKLILKLDGLEGRIEFDQLIDSFFDPKSDLPFSYWDPVKESWYSVLGDPLPCPGLSSPHHPLIEKKTNIHLIHYDILGLIYWGLNRVEEIGCEDLDEHERFPASASHAFRHGYLDRPIIDEWINVLVQVIQRQWPQQKIKTPVPDISITCDVDYPFKFQFTWLGMLKTFVGDFFKRLDPLVAFKNLTLQLRAYWGNHDKDPFFKNLNWMMEVSEKNKCRMTFYFLAGGVHKLDGDALLDYPPVRSLLREMSERGHKIGLHPSHQTFPDVKLLESEINKMVTVLTDEKIQNEVLCSRQHYLRWKTPKTAQNLSLSEIYRDSSLGYADHVGFRSGTCFEYTMFDPVGDQKMNLVQNPLVLMDVSLLKAKYMGIHGESDRKKLTKSLIRKVILLGGSCSLLWHNSAFEEQSHYDFFESIFAELK